MKRLLLPVMAILLSVAAANAAANTSLESLLLGVGARPMALGGAFASVPSGIDGIWYSPASFALVRRPSFEVSYLKSFIDQYYASLNLGAQLREGVSIGGGILYFDGGIIDLNYVDGSSEYRKAEQDLVVMAGGGGKFSEKAWGGLSLKVLSSRLVEKYHASAFAVDMGVAGEVADGFFAGVALQNAGTPLKYVSAEEPLPLVIRAGCSFRRGGLLVSFDLVDIGRLQNNPLKINAGAEYVLGDFAFRAGFGANYDIDTFTFGFGVRFGGYTKPGSIDYALQDMGSLGQFHRTSVHYEIPDEADLLLDYHSIDWEEQYDSLRRYR